MKQGGQPCEIDDGGNAARYYMSTRSKERIHVHVHITKRHHNLFLAPLLSSLSLPSPLSLEPHKEQQPSDGANDPPHPEGGQQGAGQQGAGQENGLPLKHDAVPNIEGEHVLLGITHHLAGNWVVLC